MSEKIPYEQVMGRMRMDIDYIAEGAYQKGLSRGYKDGYEAGRHEATTLEYQQGLDDAWECARRLVWETSLNEAEHMGFIAKEESTEILRDYTVTAAMKAVELYDEKSKTEIKIGDEVVPVNAPNRPFVVASIKNNLIQGFDLNGGCVSRGYFLHETNLKKTGRHFTQVAELLKAMNGEQRNCSACKHDGDPRFCDPCRHNDMWQQKEVTE